MLHRKPQIENHLESAEKRLSARVESLTTIGIDASRIQKDYKVRQFKAQIRKSKKQLTAILAAETLTAEKAETRTRKDAAAKSEPSKKKSSKRDPNTPPAKKRKKRPADLVEA